MAPSSLMAPATTPIPARRPPVIDLAGPMLFGSTGMGKSRPPLLPVVEAMLGNAAMRAAMEELRGEYDRLAGRYATLLTAAQAAVIEDRAGRNPLTPLAEALADLAAMPEPGTRLSEVLPETSAAWPKAATG